MRRREFIWLLGNAPANLASAALAQPSGKLPTIGFLGSGTPSSQRDVAAAFVQRLGELGWTDSNNIAIAYRWAEGHSERYAQIAAEFVHLNVNVIVASGSAAVAAAKRTTSTIPIVFAVVNDPLGTGIVSSLARPGGNLTGLSLQNPELAGKRLELLREAVPALRRLAILANGSNPGAVLELNDVKGLLSRLDLEPVVRPVAHPDDIQAAIAQANSDALYVCSDAVTIANRTSIAAAALTARLPTMNGPREFADAGGLMSYGANIPDLFRRAADYVDKILRGTKPADLPVEQPTKFDFIVNLKTAKNLGITVPPTLLARADEMIE